MNKPNPRSLDPSEFLEFYGEDIKKGEISGDVLEYAIDLIHCIDEEDQIFFRKYLLDIYYFMLKYRYFPEDQCELYTSLINEAYYTIDIYRDNSSNVLIEKIDCKKIYNLAISRIEIEKKFDIPDKELPEEFILKNLNIDFIKSYLDKYTKK